MHIWQMLGVILVTTANGANSIYEALRGHQVWKVEGGGGNLVGELRHRGLVDLLGRNGPSEKVRITPEKVNEVRSILQEAGVPFHVMVKDLAAYLQKDQLRRVKRDSGSKCCTAQRCPAPLHAHYMKFEQIEWYLKEVNRTYPSKISVTSIGKSVEGRDLWLAHLKAENPKGKSVWIEAGLHAREWISPAVALQLIHKLLGDVSVTADVDVFVAPMSNPDGYAYTWTNDRFWRKNRRANAGSSCVGVDLNRNWDHKFGLHASGNPCSEVYHGPAAFSEPETRALRDAMLREREGLVLVLSLHSFGQLLLYPWGWSAEEEAPGTPLLVAAGEAFAEAAEAATGARYSVENSAAGLYLASGAADDWAKAALGAEYVYTLELRDTGRFGFLLPESQVAPCSEEVWRGLARVLQTIASAEQ